MCDFTIMVGDDSNPLSTTNAECLYKCGSFGQGKKELLFCNQSLRGRYVSIHISGSAKLCFCEVKVYQWHGLYLDGKLDILCYIFYFYDSASMYIALYRNV